MHDSKLPRNKTSFSRHEQTSRKSGFGPTKDPKIRILGRCATAHFRTLPPPVQNLHTLLVWSLQYLRHVENSLGSDLFGLVGKCPAKSFFYRRPTVALPSPTFARLENKLPSPARNWSLRVDGFFFEGVWPQYPPTLERSFLLVTGIKIGEISIFFVKVPQNSSKTVRKHFQPCPPRIEEVEFST